jgi:hypothetical protein
LQLFGWATAIAIGISAILILWGFVSLISSVPSELFKRRLTLTAWVVIPLIPALASWYFQKPFGDLRRRFIIIYGYNFAVDRCVCCTRYWSWLSKNVAWQIERPSAIVFAVCKSPFFRNVLYSRTRSRRLWNL